MFPARNRKVHLDFHVSPLVKDVGKGFDPDEFIATLKKAGVNSVCCFAKCVHGMSYYTTEIGIRHPGLDFDLLGEMVNACRKNDIQVSAYFCVMWDTSVAVTHPEWLQVDENGQATKGGEYGKSFPVVCLNSSYTNDIVIPQLEEIVHNYDIGGLFLDIVYFKFCYCDNCRFKAKILGVELDGGRGSYEVARNAVQQFSQEVRQRCDAIRSGVDITHNGLLRIAPDELYASEDHFEVEMARPAARHMYMPFYVRYFRNKGKPLYGVPHRFQERWRQFGTLVESNSLRYDTALLLANGAGCSIGDQPHPSGKLDEPVYDVIGQVYSEVKRKEPWCIEARPVVEAAILCDYDYSPYTGSIQPGTAGAVRILREQHIQFDVIDPAADFSTYQLLVLAENADLSVEVIHTLMEAVRAGARIIAVTPTVTEENRTALEELLGVRFLGDSEFSTSYIAPLIPLDKGIPKMPMVVYGRPIRIKPSEKAEVLGEMIKPCFEWTTARSGDQHAPPSTERDTPFAVRNGGIMFFASPIFSSYAQQGTSISSMFMDNSLDLLLPERIVRSDAPRTVEITVNEQRGRTIVHLVNWHCSPRIGGEPETIGEIPPLFGIELTLRTSAEVTQAYLAPTLEELAVHSAGQQVRCIIPRIDVHQMVVFEYEQE